jgi:ring-1,2-phenylacetyl-CoA epoxidase subunit PaaC
MRPDGAFDAPSDAHDPVRAGYLLRLGDDALILGQRLGEWTGHAPSVEVDLSLANLALDLIGQATFFLGAAGDADELAFKRDVLDFRNCLLVEQPNGDFARTMMRQLLFSTWQHMLYQALSDSRDQAVREVAAKAVKEVAYHREIAAEWVIRLGDGTDESRARTLEALDWCVRGRISRSHRGGADRGHAAGPGRPARHSWRPARTS